MIKDVKSRYYKIAGISVLVAVQIAFGASFDVSTAFTYAHAAFESQYDWPMDVDHPSPQRSRYHHQSGARFVSPLSYSTSDSPPQSQDSFATPADRPIRGLTLNTRFFPSHTLGTDDPKSGLWILAIDPATSFTSDARLTLNAISFQDKNPADRAVLGFLQDLKARGTGPFAFLQPGGTSLILSSNKEGFSVTMVYRF